LADVRFREWTWSCVALPHGVLSLFRDICETLARIVAESRVVSRRYRLWCQDGHGAVRPGRTRWPGRWEAVFFVPYYSNAMTAGKCAISGDIHVAEVDTPRLRSTKGAGSGSAATGGFGQRRPTPRRGSVPTRGGAVATFRLRRGIPSCLRTGSSFVRMTARASWHVPVVAVACPVPGLVVCPDGLRGRNHSDRHEASPYE
jgi:hypothetical protein